MSFFLRLFSVTLHQQLRSWRIWLMMLVLPVLLFGISRCLPPEEVAAPVQVGVCLPQEGGEAFWEQLSSRSDAVISFRLADEQTITAKVSTGQWDCGLILAEDFEDRLQALDTDKLITLCTGPGSAVYPLVQEAAVCTVMELIGPGIARQYAETAGITEHLTKIEALAESQQVRITLQTLSGTSLQVEGLGQQTSYKLLLGCMAILLLVWTVFCAMDLGAWQDTDAVRRMGMFCSSHALLLPRAAASLLPPLLSSVCALAVLGTIRPIPALLGYLFTMGSLALVFSRWRPVREALLCLMPFIAVLALLTSPVLLDITVLFPNLAPFCHYLPVTLFLNACGGSLSALGFLWLEGAVLLLLFLLTGMKKYSK